MKHICKRTLSLLLVLALLFAVLPQISLPASAETYSGTCGENLTWSLNTDTGALTISGSGDMSFEGYAPWYDYRNDILSVTLSEGITFVYSYAFLDCINITQITIPDSVTRISYDAFEGCIGLRRVEIGAAVSTIDFSAFSGCSSLLEFIVSDNNGFYSNDENGVLFNKQKTKLVLFPQAKAGTYEIPDSVTGIERSAFKDCVGLTGVAIPESVSTIGAVAFENCSSLRDFTVPDTITRIGGNIVRGTAYYNDPSNWENGFLYFGNWLIGSYWEDDQNIKDGTIGIADATFYYHTEFLSITLPQSVKYIGAEAFAYSALTSIELPEGLRSIGTKAFASSGLTSIELPESLCSIGSAAFGATPIFRDASNWENNLFYLGNWMLQTGYENSNIIIKDGTVGIADEAFINDTELSSVVLPDSVKYIGDGAFKGCNGLTAVNIPSSVKRIGDYTFWACKFEQITIPKSVTCIGEYAFGGCSYLKNLTIPGSVVSIGDYAFFLCASLTGLTIPDSVASIGNYAFYNCFRLTSMIIPDSVISLGVYSFGYIYGQKIDDFTIYGYPGSEAQTYAAENGFTFIPLDPETGFSDVSATAYYHDAVIWAVQNGVTGGTSDVTFSPKQTCTRAQVMTFLWKAYDSPEPASMENPFSDVQPGKYYEEPILWAYYHEPQVTGGMNATTFGVKNSCTRAQVVMFLWAAAGKPEPTTTENPFSDVKEKDYFYKAVLWAVENGITGGTTPTTFSPKQTCTRAQVVTFLYKAVG